MEKHICRNCGYEGNGNHCAMCGEKYTVLKITVKSIVHQAFKFFSNFDKGFAYTVKQLLERPGYMQRKYIEGFRSKHQKPFAFFFVSATLCGSAFYLINIANRMLYGKINVPEDEFFKSYFVFVQVGLLPLFALVLWLSFFSSNYNYAEILVLMLYTMGTIFLVLIVINAFKMVFPNFDIRYIEVFFLLFYWLLTNLNFFVGSRKWVVILITILNLTFCFGTAQLVTDIAKNFLHK